MRWPVLFYLGLLLPGVPGIIEPAFSSFAAAWMASLTCLLAGSSLPTPVETPVFRYEAFEHPAQIHQTEDGMSVTFLPTVGIDASQSKEMIPSGEDQAIFHRVSLGSDRIRWLTEEVLQGGKLSLPRWRQGGLSCGFVPLALLVQGQAGFFL